MLTDKEKLADSPPNPASTLKICAGACQWQHVQQMCDDNTEWHEYKVEQLGDLYNTAQRAIMKVN